MRRNRNTKITATLGPASSSEDVIEQLYVNGVDIFRLNFSHGLHADHALRVETIRRLESKYDRPITIVLDLQGPKLRVGRFQNDYVDLKKDQSFRLDLDPTLGDESRVQLPHPEIFAALEPMTDLLVDDGKIRLKVLSFGADFAETKVIVPGRISHNKGVNVPGVALPISVLTEKDRKDLAFGLDLGVDFVALSFVQKPEDVLEARDLIQGRAKIISKLEKPQAIEHLEEIVRLSDGVLVARGDLGVEMLPEEVPSIQKRIIRICREQGRPVLVATQMLDSMVTSPTPTRAEASDVATAVYDGADGVMLSAESASGAYPVESVAMMDRIILQVEKDSYYKTMLDLHHSVPEATASDAITMAANQVSRTIGAKAIVTYTETGSTTLRASRERPAVPILALTSNMITARQLNFSWGVHAVKCQEVSDFFHMSEVTSRLVLAEGLAKDGDSVVITAGIPFDVSDQTQIFAAGTTNLLRILQVKSSASL
ncbi:MAG: pyruvate kinase [Alphaproteobacteria bacterium]|nr:pyruvate kinase [Alphaproteobacteria bacterium]